MLTALVGVVNQRVRWQARIEDLAGAFYARDGQGASIEQAELSQHGRLVPVDVLVDQLALPESNNGDERNLNTFSRRSKAGQHPVHSYGMGELTAVIA